MYYVKDFRVLHCGLLDVERIAAKNRFYQFVDWEMNHRSPIALGRSYSGHYKRNITHDTQYTLESEAIAFPFDFWSLIEMHATHTWFDDYIYKRINNYPLAILRRLDIWDEDFLRYYEVKDPRKCWDKLLHMYLHTTNKYKKSIIIRAIDKLLKYLYK